MTTPPLILSFGWQTYSYFIIGGSFFLPIAKAFLNPRQSRGFSLYNKKTACTNCRLSFWRKLQYMKVKILSVL